MADVYKGLTIKFGAETTGLDAALKSVTTRASAITRELGQVKRGLKFDSSSTVLLGQKHQLLAEKIANTRQRLDALKQSQDRIAAMYRSGEIDEGKYRAFQRDVVTTENKLKTFEGQLKGVQKEQKAAGSAAKVFGDKLGLSGAKADELRAKLARLHEKIGTVARVAATAGAAAAAAFGAMTLASIKTADETARLAEVTGLSTERIQELKYIGQKLDVELDTMTLAQTRLTKAMNAARNGTKAQEAAFKKLGVSVTDSHGNLRDAKVVMGEAFDALSKMGNATERDTLSLLLFGKSAMDLNPVIKAGSKELGKLTEAAHKNGAVMSDEAVKGLDELNDTFETLKTVGLAAVGEKFAELAPAIQGMIDKVQAGQAPLAAIRDQMKQSFGIDLTPVTNAIDGISRALSAIGLAAQALWAIIGPFFTWCATTIRDALLPAFESLRQAFATPEMQQFAKVVGVVIVAAIVALVGAIVLLVVAFAKIIQGVTWVIRKYAEWVAATHKLNAQVTSAFSSMGSSVVAKINAIRSSVAAIFGRIRDAITGPINAAVGAVARAIDRIRGFFAGLRLRLPPIEIPHIELPYFSISGSFNPLKMQVPTVGVEWKAQGGVADRAMLYGVGERGKEAILPLSAAALRPFADQIARLMPSGGGQVFNITGPLNFHTAAAVDRFLDRADMSGMAHELSLGR